jgi:hypothetical protein
MKKWGPKFYTSLENNAATIIIFPEGLTARKKKEPLLAVNKFMIMQPYIPEPLTQTQDEFVWKWFQLKHT